MTGIKMEASYVRCLQYMLLVMILLIFVTNEMASAAGKKHLNLIRKIIIFVFI